VKSKKGYWIGGAVIAAGVLGAVLWFVVGFVRIDDQIDGFQRAPVPREATVRLEAQKYVIYFEGENADEVVPRFELAIADAESGEPLEIEPYNNSLTYSFGEEGSAQATVTPARAGDYVVTTDGGEGGVAVGDSIAGPLLRTIAGAFAIGGLLAFAGVILLVVTAIRRRRGSA
jgi:hypothetical protein